MAIKAKAEKAALVRNIPTEKRYAAARPTRLGQAWQPLERPVNQLISISAPVLKTRVRQLVRDFPPFTRAVNILVDWTVGTGLTFQSKCRRYDGSIDQESTRKIEDAWNAWCDEADIRKFLHFDDMQRLARRQDAEAGEFLFVAQMSQSPNRVNPLYLKAYETDWLTSDSAKDATGAALIDDNYKTGIGAATAGTRISAGIEYDGLSGEILAYHLREPGTTHVPIRVPARQVIHGFDVLRPQQIHGVSPLVSAIMLAKDISDYMDTEIDAAHMASKWLAFVTTNDASGFQADVMTNTRGEKRLEVENAIVEFLQQGEDIKINDPKRPSGMFEPFIKFVLRLMAVGVGISYELLSGDYSGLTYSNLKAIRNDIIRGFKPMVARHRFQFCRKVFSWWMDSAVLNGQLFIPGYWERRASCQRGVWLPPGYESLDPLRETKADIDQVAALLKSPQEIAAERGRDYEELLDELAIAKRLMDEYGLTPEKTSTNMKNNPAAIQEDNDD